MLRAGASFAEEAKVKPARCVAAIRASGLTIYDAVEVGSRLWIPAPELELLLDAGLRGVDLVGLPLRTRSKRVKERVCEALGYPVPKSFGRKRPRFPGQQLDIYVQKSNNLQVWNEQLDAIRRYALVRVSAENSIARVKVVTGETLAKLDTTGTLTQKYQARLIAGSVDAELISDQDTDRLKPCVSAVSPKRFDVIPIEHATPETLLPIATVFQRLRSLVGKRFADSGHDQERNRGAALHRLVCEALGYRSYQDDGRFPDVRHQLLEVKLQTASTIDLGLVTPASEAPLDEPQILSRQIRHCDVRYAIFSAQTDGTTVTLTRLYLTTGRDFFARFPQCQGRVLNRKLQIPLPRDFFDR
jgi:hypothetical protein